MTQSGQSSNGANNSSYAASKRQGGNGPTGGQDAGFETFMPSAEQQASKTQGGNENSYGGKYMTRSGQSSNGANNSSYAASKRQGGDGPTGGQDAGFETFMPPAEQQASKRQGGNENSYGGKYMTQSGQSSNGANNSSYAAQYGGNYAQQYLPGVFLMAQSGSSEQGSKKKVSDGGDYHAKYSEKYDKPEKTGKGGVNCTEKVGSYYQAKYGGSYASKYGKSSQAAKNSTAKTGSYYQATYGGQYASQDGRTSQAAISSKADNSNQLERGGRDVKRSGKPSNLAESQGQTQHSNLVLVFLSVAALAVLILTSWVSGSAFFSRSGLAPPEEVAT